MVIKKITKKKYISLMTKMLKIVPKIFIQRLILKARRLTILTKALIKKLQIS